MNAPTIRRRWGRSSGGTGGTDDTTEAPPTINSRTVQRGKNFVFEDPSAQAAWNRSHPTPARFQKKRANGTPCEHYLWTGRCKYGDGCKYSHKEPDSEEDMMRTPGEIFRARQDERTEYCRHYQKGRCTYGNNCRHSHEQPRTGGYETNAARSTRALKCKDYPNCKIGCSPEKEYCHHFFKYGNCKFGDKCRLAHDSPYHEVAPDCKHYEAKGFCKMGCRPGKTYCHRYWRYGECPHGKNCKRSHSPPSFRPSLSDSD